MKRASSSSLTQSWPEPVTKTEIVSGIIYRSAYTETVTSRGPLQCHFAKQFLRSNDIQYSHNFPEIYIMFMFHSYCTLRPLCRMSFLQSTPLSIFHSNSYNSTDLVIHSTTNLFSRVPLRSRHTASLKIEE